MVNNEFGNSNIPACFVMKCRAICEECGFAVDRPHCPTTCHCFHCAEHCPECTGELYRKQDGAAAEQAQAA